MTAITKFVGTIIAGIALTYIAFFAVVNDMSVFVHLWPQTQALHAPLWLVILIAFSLGLLLVALLANIRISTLRLRLYHTQKKLDKQLAQADTNNRRDADQNAIADKS